MEATPENTHDEAPHGEVTESGLILHNDEERIEIWSRAFAHGAPLHMKALVWHYAREHQLDPLRGEVMCISFRRQDGQDDYAVLIGIHGMVRIASRQPDFRGLSSAVVYPGERCIIRADQSVEHEYDIQERHERRASATQGARLLPIGAWATVRRQLGNDIMAFTTYVPFEQCAQTRWDAKKRQRVLAASWATRPDWMIEKCAIAFSIRKGFVHAVGRAYVAEEVGATSEEHGIETRGSAATIIDEAKATENEPKRMEGAKVSPAVKAGMVPGSATPRISDLWVDENPDADAEEAEGPPAQQAPDEAPVDGRDPFERLLAAASAAEARFSDPPRRFLREASNRLWLVDGETIAMLGLEGAQDVAKLNDATIAGAVRIINEITNRKEAARGRG